MPARVEEEDGTTVRGSVDPALPRGGVAGPSSRLSGLLDVNVFVQHSRSSLEHVRICSLALTGPVISSTAPRVPAPAVQACVFRGKHAAGRIPTGTLLLSVWFVESL